MAGDSEWKTRQTLLEKIRDQHNETAWEDFVHYYQKYIYNIVRQMNLTHHDAEEITQKVIMKSWKKLPQFQYHPGKGRFRGWLCRVTGNEVKDFIRIRKKFLLEADSIQNDDDEKNVSYLEQICLPEIETIAEKEWKNYVSKIAWKNIEPGLEEKQRKVFLMSVENVPPAEIASETGIAESSVYVYKKRVQDKLREEIVRLNRELM